MLFDGPSRCTQLLPLGHQQETTRGDPAGGPNLPTNIIPSILLIASIIIINS